MKSHTQNEYKRSTAISKAVLLHRCGARAAIFNLPGKGITPPYPISFIILPPPRGHCPHRQQGTFTISLRGSRGNADAAHRPPGQAFHIRQLEPFNGLTWAYLSYHTWSCPAGASAGVASPRACGSTSTRKGFSVVEKLTSRTAHTRFPDALMCPHP